MYKTIGISSRCLFATQLCSARSYYASAPIPRSCLIARRGVESVCFRFPPTSEPHRPAIPLPDLSCMYLRPSVSNKFELARKPLQMQSACTVTRAVIRPTGTPYRLRSRAVRERANGAD